MGSIPEWEDPLEEEMATHSSILAWRIPQTEGLVGCSPWGLKELDTTEHTHTGDNVYMLLYINLCVCACRHAHAHTCANETFKEFLLALACFTQLFIYNFCSTKQKPRYKYTVNSLS